MLPSLFLLQTTQLPIFEQLQLEEALLRTDERNWCLINKGSSPAIVMGISGKADQLINSEHIQANPIPIIRRFSGGGTVVVDDDTFFITLICKATTFHGVQYPQQIMQWTESLYKPVFMNHPFTLLDNDYVLGNKKFGGNAQYLCKNRWLHHTSFLWDFKQKHMNYLKMPIKSPLYRQNRSHEEFLCKLKDFLPCQDTFINQFVCSLKQKFNLEYSTLEEAKKSLLHPHRKATEWIQYG